MSFEIDKIAELARLKLKDGEKQSLSAEVNAVLEYVKKLEELQTDSVEPTSHVLNLENVFRKDEVKPSHACEDALKHAPGSYGKFFKVPKVVEKE